MKTREFRVDDYGAPRYPELVLVVKRRRSRSTASWWTRCSRRSRSGTFDALHDRDATVKKLVDASGADEPLMRAQLAAVGRALLPPISLDREALEGWAAFDKQFGILHEEPDVERAFRLR